MLTHTTHSQKKVIASEIHQHTNLTDPYRQKITRSTPVIWTYGIVTHIQPIYLSNYSLLDSKRKKEKNDKVQWYDLNSTPSETQFITLVTTLTHKVGIVAKLICETGFTLTHAQECVTHTKRYSPYNTRHWAVQKGQTRCRCKFERMMASSKLP